MASTHGRDRRSMHRAAGAVLCGVLLTGAMPGGGPAPAHAQSPRVVTGDTLILQVNGVVVRRPSRPTVLAPGARVRLRTWSGGEARVDGWIDRMDEDRVVLVAPRGAGEREILLADLRRIEMETDRNARDRGLIVGLTLGAATGAVAGALIGAASEPDCTSGEWMCFQGLSTFAGVLAGIGIGGLLGGAVGWMVAPDGWVEVPVGGLQAATVPSGITVRVPVR